jgi:hypothetical protein
MSPKLLKLSIVGMLAASSSMTFAAEDSSIVPQSSFFAGIGVSQNRINFNNQQTWAVGTTVAPATSNTPPIDGTAGGGTRVYLPAQNSTAPSVQLGYFARFKDSDMLWGAKFNYSYLGATSTVTNQLIPQTGGYNNGNGYTTFTGNYVVRSYQQSIMNQISLTPFIGQAYSKGYFYAGAGPSISQVKTNINGITGFADLFGIPSNISGALQTYSATQWVVGGSATVGGTYYLDKSFFLDLNYSYTQTKNTTANWAGPWSKRGIWSPGGFNAVEYTGTNTGNSSGNVGAQAITLTLNKSF